MCGSIEFLNHLALTGNEGGKWTIPFSWQSVYGPPADMSIF